MHNFTHRSLGPNNLSPKNVKEIADDLDNAFSEKSIKDHIERTEKIGKPVTLKMRNVAPEHIQDVYVFTWLKMAHKLDVSNSSSFLISKR